MNNVTALPKDIRARNIELFKSVAPELSGHLSETGRRSTCDYQPLQPQAVPEVRFTAPGPEPQNIDQYTFRFLDRALRDALNANISGVDWPTASTHYFLILFGLHHHLFVENIIERSKCMGLIIALQSGDDLDWSMDHVDWARVFQLVHDRGGNIDFAIYDDAETLSATMWRSMRLMNPASVDNTLFKTFGRKDMAEKVIDIFSNELSLAYSGIGFFYDECLMIWNSYSNLTSREGHVFQRQMEAERERPIFVVASGPSLDTTIDTVKAHADDAIIVSCGSALRPLLTEGIVPDFQIEIENLGVSEITRQAAKEFDLSSITLVASVTVDPDSIANFANHLFFFRYALSPYPLFSASLESTILYPDPTVGNAGLSFALELGFDEIYIFGMDCGSKEPSQHHSKDAYQYTPDAGRIDIEYDIRVPANFGGVSWTNFGLLGSISNAVGTIRSLGEGRRIYNCSDGAEIIGAHALYAGDIDIIAAESDKSETKEKMLSSMPTFSGAAQSFEWMTDDFQKTIRGYCNLVRARLSDISDYNDKRYLADLMEMLQLRLGFFAPPPPGINHCVNILFRGTLLTMLLFMERSLARIADQDRYNEYAQIFITSFMTAIDELEKDALDRFGGDQPKPPPPFDTIRPETGSVLPVLSEPGRNTPCPCGSGKRYKHCHGNRL